MQPRASQIQPRSDQIKPKPSQIKAKPAKIKSVTAQISKYQANSDRHQQLADLDEQTIFAGHFHMIPDRINNFHVDASVLNSCFVPNTGLSVRVLIDTWAFQNSHSRL